MLFQLFRLFDSKPHGKQPINICSIYVILTPIVARYGPSKPPEHLFTSGFPHRYCYIAVARFSTCGDKMLGDPWHLAEPRWSLQSGGMGATSVLIGQHVC